MSNDALQAEEIGHAATQASPDPTAVLVLGIGNILLCDEGVGVRAIEAMQPMDLPSNVELVDAGTAGADLVDIIAHRRKVIVVDAIEAGAAPGTVFRLRGDELMPDSGVAISLHQLGLVESLTMAEQLECAPKEVIVFGVQPDKIRPGLELSAPVANAVSKVIDAVLFEVRADA
jgi:hydrogenase maturation protease